MELFRLSLGCIYLLPWLEAVAEGQGFLIKNTRLEKCICASHETHSISLASCKEHSQQQRWAWDPDSGTIISLHTKYCLSAHRMHQDSLVKLEPCADREHQAWSCSKKGHLTLQSLGFHLGTKEGGHKVFVSREKDKFSRWKTLADETICAAAQTAAQRPRKPTQQVPDTRVWTYETKTIDSPKIDAVDKESSVSLTDTPLANLFNSTVSPAKTKQAQLPANEGTNWKTAMLVLSPLAFILGLIILTLNVHYNKKKKILSALKSSPANSSRVDLREPTPSRRVPQLYLPPSRSPSLRHGEILIEWKDGTVTPLFDNINYQVD
ncbi:hypothetical protein RLOC_00015083 [Lonchura striata]|uniref:Ricin B lectin domain-containing protein n=1 Tax=Lonchura striata TaxID=40157 RepID=A0A218UYR0_9PASE|nr:uncharacterized protein LOC110484146 isoform X2 [Lonchura striata domestica]OWK58778.1 hypothetical protein RLOC_00015083 [Lonchura striata domestica]